MKVTFFTYQPEHEIIEKILYTYPWLEVDSNNYELVIVIGGDGTFISALKHFINQDVKILLYSIGRLGFFSDSLNCLRPTLNPTDFHQFPYLFIETDLGSTYLAINEFVLWTHNNPLEYQIYLDKEPWYQYNGTGIIVSTINGTTGINRSQNGPLLLDNNLFVYQELLPVKNLQTTYLDQPVVLNDTHTITFQVLTNKKPSLALKIDGIEQQLNDVYKLQISQKYSKAQILNFVDTKKWIKRLKEKLIGE